MPPSSHPVHKPVPSWKTAAATCLLLLGLPAVLATQQPSESHSSPAPTRLRVTSSIEDTRRSAKAGWADVGYLVSGHGRALLIPPTGDPQPISFYYIDCPGSVALSVLRQGGFPRLPSAPPNIADCPLRIFPLASVDPASLTHSSPPDPSPSQPSTPQPHSVTSPSI